MGEIRNAYKMLVMKPEGKRPSWRNKEHGKWESVIKT
jgi:hypothetical protein